ncbi:hypothetical protein KHA97_16535 [Bacillus sp. FJAT-49870]|uniref:YkoP-like domain-containing protein n=1 Tax=Lederbergia citri TaxID=2833580 RepID=A0A942THX2_9BACI|nr:hypothetical protein [Lederbergia citri]
MKQYCLSAWNFIDPLYFQFTRLQYIKKTCGDNSIFRVRLTKYKGRNIVLSDGTTITKNDVLVKIHLHNAKLLQQMYKCDNEIRRALLIYKGVKESLPSLVNYMQSQEKADQIKGLIGITMLYKGCKKLGFEAHPIASPIYKNFKKVSLLPIYFLSSSRGIKKEIPSPMYLFMSKDALTSRYRSE